MKFTLLGIDLVTYRFLVRNRFGSVKEKKKSHFYTHPIITQILESMK